MALDREQLQWTENSAMEIEQYTGQDREQYTGQRTVALEREQYVGHKNRTLRDSEQQT